MCILLVELKFLGLQGSGNRITGLQTHTDQNIASNRKLEGRLLFEINGHSCCTRAPFVLHTIGTPKTASKSGSFKPWSLEPPLSCALEPECRILMSMWPLAPLYHPAMFQLSSFCCNLSRAKARCIEVVVVEVHDELACSRAAKRWSLFMKRTYNLLGGFKTKGPILGLPTIRSITRLDLFLGTLFTPTLAA